MSKPLQDLAAALVVVTPELTASGLDNLDSLIQPYIKAEPAMVAYIVNLNCKHPTLQTHAISMD